MASIKLTDITKSIAAAKTFAKKTDLDKDGIVTNAETKAIASHLSKTNQTATPSLALDTLMQWSKKKFNDTSVKDLVAAADDLGKRIKAADKDGDGQLSDTEQKSLRTNGERGLVQFALAMKGKSAGDFDLKTTLPPEKPGFFDYRGTPVQVCENLLKAFSRKSNDNFWPTWSGLKTPSRYVLDSNEAKAMVGALKKLFDGKQKSVLQALSDRTQMSGVGCVSPDAAAQAIFKDYAKSLGMNTLPFKGPVTAPKMPAP